MTRKPARRKQVPDLDQRVATGPALQPASRGQCRPRRRRRAPRRSWRLLLLVCVVGALIALATSTPPPPPLSGGPFGVGNWPGASWRPFASDSPFNKSLPDDPQLDQNSADIVDRMFDIARYDLPAEFTADVKGSGGEPTYYSNASDPVFTVHCTLYECPSMEGKKVHIPAGAKPEEGSDRHLTVIDQTTDPAYEYDFWVVKSSAVPATGGTLSARAGGRTPISGPGIMERDGGSATAASFASMAGRVRAEELAAGQINHALFVAVDCTNGQVVYPAANGHGGQACSAIGQPDTGAPAMGQHLRLNYSDAEINALNAPPWRKVIYRAMARYGMFIGDTGTANLVQIETESDYMYSSFGRPGRWLSFARANGWFYFDGDGDGDYAGSYIGDFGNKTNPDGLDWRRLQVVAPCVSQGTCGAGT